MLKGKEFIPRHTESGFKDPNEAYYVEKDHFIHDRERTMKCFRVMARGKNEEGNTYIRPVEERLAWDDARTLANNMNQNGRTSS